MECSVVNSVVECTKVVRTLVFWRFLLPNVLRATTACTFSTFELPKVVRIPGVINILTSKCASRHNAVHFFDISTSKSAPRPPIFNTFDFQMCFAPQNGVHFFDILTSKSTPRPSIFNTFYFQIYFAPQRRALFRHLNFQNCSEPLVFNIFYFQMYFFLISQLLKAVRSWGVLYLFTSKSASCHNGVQLFISHLPRCLRTRRFSEPTFQLSGVTKPRKNPVLRDFLTFSRTCIFFWSFLFWLFSLLTAFSSLYIVGNLTSKFPLIIMFLGWFFRLYFRWFCFYIFTLYIYIIIIILMMIIIIIYIYIYYNLFFKKYFNINFIFLYYMFFF